MFAVFYWSWIFASSLYKLRYFLHWCSVCGLIFVIDDFYLFTQRISCYNWVHLYIFISYKSVTCFHQPIASFTNFFACLYQQRLFFNRLFQKSFKNLLQNSFYLHHQMREKCIHIKILYLYFFYAKKMSRYRKSILIAFIYIWNGWLVEVWKKNSAPYKTD